MGGLYWSVLLLSEDDLVVASCKDSPVLERSQHLASRRRAPGFWALGCCSGQASSCGLSELSCRLGLAGCQSCKTGAACGRGGGEAA